MTEVELNSVQNCPSCGGQRKEGSAFCTKCGAALAVHAGPKEQDAEAMVGTTQEKHAYEEESRPSFLGGARNTFSRAFDSLTNTFALPSSSEDPDESLSQEPLAKLANKNVLTHPTELTVNAPTIVLKRFPASEPKRAKTRPLRQNAGWLTDNGLRREHNEDLVAALTFGLDQSGYSEPIGLYVVADGMGGQAAGEEASDATVRRAFLRFIEEQIMPDLRERRTRKLVPEEIEFPQTSLASLVQEANRLVYQANKETGSKRGTTITAALISGDQATIANVGDSRTYLFRDGSLECITEDHSLVFRQYQAGLISEEQVYTHPRKNEIYRALGDSVDVQVDIYRYVLRTGDQLLLCSDGLWEMVRNPKIEQIMSGATGLQIVCDRLVEEANANGGEDNISVVVVSME